MDPGFSFGEWIRKRRKTLNLTLQALADRVGYSVAMLRKIEKDERRPSQKAVALLAEALEIPEDQQDTFLKVARHERPVAQLGPAHQEERFPWQSPSQPQTNLPVPATLLVGREPELARLAELLQDPACRLITLVGLAGIGKTHLAVQAAHGQLERFVNGVFFVSLAPVASPELIVTTVAKVIGFLFREADEPQEQLLCYLREKRMLLVLDNFEHLMEGVSLLSAIMQTAPGIQILVTSRERLNLQAEWVFMVEGLPYPAGSEESRLEQVEAYGAVQLFLQSAQRVNPSFSLNEKNWEWVVRLCQLMEGMPLGIELAAAWVRVLSCPEIAKEIQSNLDFLKASARDIPERHRSLRAALDHSWNLLLSREQEVFQRLSVFRGGFRREAAEEVAEASLHEITSLLDKSLLKRVGEERYDLHELVRQYAATHLAEDAQDQAKTLHRHCKFYLEQFSEQENALNSGAQAEVVREQSQEIGNVRTAWHQAVARGDFFLINRALNTFRLFYDVCGWFQEAIEQIELATQALRANPTSSPDLMGRLFDQQSWFRSRCGQYGAARDLSKQSLALLRASGPQPALANALLFGAIIAYRTGDLSEAQQLADEGLMTARMIHSDWLIAFGLCVQGIVAQIGGRHSEAYERLHAGLDGFRAFGNPHLIGFALNYLAPITLHLGHIDEAQTLLEESLAMNQRAGDRWGLGTCYGNLGLVAQARGDWNAAQSLFRQAVDTFGELGARGYTAEYLVHLGEASAASGDVTEPERIFREAIRVASQAQATPSMADAIVGLADLLARSGEKPETLFEWLHVVQTHPAAHAATRQRAAGLRAKLMVQLEPQQIKAAEARAQAATLEALAQEILITD